MTIKTKYEIGQRIWYVYEYKEETEKLFKKIKRIAEEIRERKTNEKWNNRSYKKTE